MAARRLDALNALIATFDTSNGGAAHALEHDVTNRREIPRLFQESARLLGGLDTILYTAGVMHDVEPEEYSTEKDSAMIEVNLLGAIAWLNEAAHRFSAIGTGRIVGISSIAGDRGRRGNPVYCTSKAALNTYLESLRNRLSVKGITVTTVKPGFVNTAMVEGKSGLIWLISPAKAAKVILGAVERGREHFYVPSRWWIVGRIVKSIPSFIFRRLNI